MATIDYTTLLEKITPLINNNGRSFTIKTDAITPVDASKPWASNTVAVADIVATGIFSNVTAQEVDGELVKQGDKKIIIEGSVDAGVKIADRILDGSTTYSIISVKEVKPASTALLYILFVRG
jgi:hypothetical protein